MPPKARTGPSKGGDKRSSSSKPSTSASSSKSKKPSGPRPKPVQQKTKSKTPTLKKKPPHLRYTEKDLKLPSLNGIRPAGVQKPPNAKKGKTFVDDKEQMNAILAIVMAEKEGNIESKMMRSRQLEEVREARRIEAEKRVESKKAGLEERKKGIKEDGRKKGKGSRDDSGPAGAEVTQEKVGPRKLRKRVSFG
ncbi:60S ribosomal subunit assembly/export protein [Recurvomyces mirabilis]|uniref:60S ribosomal subunit assembly/export protein n=1 Tax=Recurvomyces mirabilis TaxID=574656 RepID=A0AAE0TQ42_9PEZI|nr:60S ribosomal subunit assembly/export protein [Recurvomyces mirabilis]KAK5155441.1 60S ribosomal subunit assembly/export protein [Recurvomyces mirabilis]